MLGNNESARVSASRVLMDALTEPEQDKTEQRKADFARAQAPRRVPTSRRRSTGGRVS
jgi:hypothetical protein